MNAGLVEPKGKPERPRNDPMQRVLMLAAGLLAKYIDNYESTEVGFVIVAARKGSSPAGNLYIASNLPEETVAEFMHMVAELKR